MTFDFRSFGANDFVLAGGFEEADLEYGVGGPMDRCPKAGGQRRLGWTGKVTPECFRHFPWPWVTVELLLAFWGWDLTCWLQVKPAEAGPPGAFPGQVQGCGLAGGRAVSFRACDC